MSEPLYTVTIHQLATGKWRWEIETSDVDNHPLWPSEYFKSESHRGAHRTFRGARKKASRVLAEYVERDVLEQLRDSFESNTPIAQASVS